MENLQIDDNKIYEYFKSVMPDLLFIPPYSNRVIPKTGMNFFTPTILFKQDIGYNQQEILDENGKVNIIHNQLKEITVQIDFYGKDAGKYVELYKQLLNIKLFNDNGKGILDLKNIGETRNLTFLDTSKIWTSRYNFDAELYLIDAVKIPDEIITDVSIKLTRL